MIDEEEAAAFRAWQATADTASSARPQEVPASIVESAPKESDRDEDDLDKNLWMAKRAGQYDEVAKQEWLAKRAGKVWSKQTKNERVSGEFFSAPTSKAKPLADEFAQEAQKAKREGNYAEAAKQEWLAKRAGQIWSSEKKKSPSAKPDLGPAAAPKKSDLNDEFAQEAQKAKREGKYAEAAKQEWLAKRAGQIWSSEKKKSPISKPDLGPPTVAQKPHTYVDDAAKQAWQAKMEGNREEAARQEWMASRAGSKTE
jgi:hypothetical protein